MDKRRRPSNRRYQDEWLKRLRYEEEKENILLYPEEAEDSPKSRTPEDINTTKLKYGTKQAELSGHLFIPYYHLPPQGARFIDSINSQSIAAGSTATVISATTITTNNAVLRWFGNEITDSSGYPNVSWTIYVNGVAYGPWNGVTLSLGFINIPSLIFIRLTLGDIFRVDATNNGSVTYTVRTRIKGWTWN